MHEENTWPIKATIPESTECSTHRAVACVCKLVMPVQLHACAVYTCGVVEVGGWVGMGQHWVFVVTGDRS